MAEKKSTKAKLAPKKRAVKKVEEPKPTSEVQPAVEPVKPREINWDVIGFSSAAVTLAGAALLFLLGWAYEANWYGFFGVGMSQVSIQPQDVIIQSFPGLVTIGTCLFASIVANYFISYISEFVKQFRNRREVEKLPVPPEEQTKTQVLDYSITDWMFVLTLTEGLLLILWLIIYTPIVTQRLGTPTSIWTIYEVTYFGFLVLIIVVAFFITGFLFMIISSSGFVFLSLYLAIRSRFKPTKKVYIDNPGEIKVPPKVSVLAFLVFLIILTSLVLSAIYGINDAAEGIHSGTWRVQKVKVISSTSNPWQQMGLSYCYTDYCESLPFGLIGRNDNAYILIPWSKVEGKYFQYNAGVILLPQSDDVILVPYKYGQ